MGIHRHVHRRPVVRGVKARALAGRELLLKLAAPVGCACSCANNAILCWSNEVRSAAYILEQQITMRIIKGIQRKVDIVLFVTGEGLFPFKVSVTSCLFSTTRLLDGGDFSAKPSQMVVDLLQSLGTMGRWRLVYCGRHRSTNVVEQSRNLFTATACLVRGTIATRMAMARCRPRGT